MSTENCPVILEWTAGKAYNYVGDLSPGAAGAAASVGTIIAEGVGTIIMTPLGPVGRNMVYCLDHQKYHLFEPAPRRTEAEQAEVERV